MKEEVDSIQDLNSGENFVEAEVSKNPEDRIYDVAVNKDIIDWKSFLYELIYKEGLDPWDIDLGILTKKYLIALRDLKEVDFNISGKFLTVAVYLLKTKSEKLLSSDIRGFEDELEEARREEGEIESIDFDELEDPLDFNEENSIVENRRKEYKLKFRNPIARKRKVNIFDLIKTLEKTFEQSNKRRANYLQRHGGDIDYTGPTYEKKKKDLKEVIDDLFEEISSHLKEKEFLEFNHLIKDSKTKLDVIDVFIPLLHLHNQVKVEVKQDSHLDNIKIYLTD